MAKLPQRQQLSLRVDLSERNAERCLCPCCPTHNSDPCSIEKDELIYCSIGPTDCRLHQKYCICFNCRNFEEYGLRVGYFCFLGEAKHDGNPVQSHRGIE